MLNLLRDGGGVRISERNRLRSFEMVLDAPAVVWCLETLHEVLLTADNKSFLRKYRGSNIVLLAEKTSSRNGLFFKITKLSNGRLDNIIILGGFFF